MTARPYRIGAHFTADTHAEIESWGEKCAAGHSQVLRGLARCALDNCKPADIRAYIAGERT